MRMRALALSIAALFLAAPAWAGDRPRGGIQPKAPADDDDEADDAAGDDTAPAADDDDDDDAPPPTKGKTKDKGKTKGTSKSKASDTAKRKAADADDDDDADADADDDADDDDAGDDDDDGKAPSGWSGRKARSMATDDDDDDADDDDADDDDDAPVKKKARKPAKKAAHDADDDDDDAADDADAADDDDTAADADDDDADDDAAPRKKKHAKATKKKRRPEPEPEPEPEDTGPHVVAPRDVAPPRWTFGAEALGAKPVDGLNSDLYGMGGGIGVGIERTLSPALGVHASASYLSFPASKAMDATSWTVGQVGPRWHLGAKLWGAATHHDAWLDGHVTFGTSGGIARPGFDLGAALLWEVSPAVRVGPMLRYAFGADPLDKHAQVVNVGLALGFGGRSRAAIHIEGDLDGDGLVDRIDACPDELPGDHPDAERAGCPVHDADEDGVADDADECGDLPAGDHPDPERAGCPVPDLDEDGVLDADDQCPEQPGPARAGGCPLARVQDQKIEILEQIFFENDSATISDKSQPVLNAIGEVIAGLPDGVRVSIEGHTDEAGTDAYNLNLSKRRARAVAQWLIENAGIDAARLETQGYGKRRPLVVGPEADTSKNRRVEFVILEAK